MNIRQMTVAGQFYEANPQLLKKQFEKFAAASKEELPLKKNVHSIIVPHAGYVYSGKTAFDAFYQARDCSFEKIVIIAPSHYVGFSGVSLPDYNLSDTPFGSMELDLDSLTYLKSQYFIHNSQPHQREHSLEVQLPLVKHFFPQSKIIPLVCGQLNESMPDDLIDSLQKLWNDKTLWVISSDFTHYGRSFGYLPFSSNIKENLHDLDGKAIEYILALDEKGFVSYLQKTGATICGANPIRLILNLLNKQKEIGSKVSSKLIKYTTSGELTGDYSHCVSYASIIFYS